MGQIMSCVSSDEDLQFFGAVELGEVELVGEALERDPGVLHSTATFARHTPLHVAAANGRLEVLSMLLEKSVQPDILNRHKQTPLMLAAMHGKISCVERLIQAGANILMFDSSHGRTCLHYAAYYGHLNCLQAILSTARSSPIANSWGFSRFVNVRDNKGATPLHLAAKQRRSACVHALLDNGALVHASTGTYGYPGSSALHLAARAGSLESIRALLAWGADRLQIDSAERIPFTVAYRRNHLACAALLDPASPEPLVWPSPLKFIKELSLEAKVLLERALMKASVEREKSILQEMNALTTPHSHSNNAVNDDIAEDTDKELCCICFDQQCTIEVRSCGHQMCASCILALCCHSKPNPKTLTSPTPVCPFCRSDIAQLVVAEHKTKEDNVSKMRKSRRSRNLSGGSNSFKSLASVMGSFGKLSRGSGRISNSSEITDKP